MPRIWAPKRGRIPALKYRKFGPCGVAIVSLLCPLSLPPKKPIPCPNPGETSVCQCHCGCNLQPAPQAVGAAGLLENSGLECHKQLSARQGIRPLLVTELYRQKWCPDSGPDFEQILARFWPDSDRVLTRFLTRVFG